MGKENVYVILSTDSIKTFIFSLFILLTIIIYDWLISEFFLNLKDYSIFLICIAFFLTIFLNFLGYFLIKDRILKIISRLEVDKKNRILRRIYGKKNLERNIELSIDDIVEYKIIRASSEKTKEIFEYDKGFELFYSGSDINRRYLSYIDFGDGRYICIKAGTSKKKIEKDLEKFKKMIEE